MPISEFRGTKTVELTPEVLDKTGTTTVKTVIDPEVVDQLRDIGKKMFAQETDILSSIAETSIPEKEHKDFLKTTTFRANALRSQILVLKEAAKLITSHEIVQSTQPKQEIIQDEEEKPLTQEQLFKKVSQRFKKEHGQTPLQMLTSDKKEANKVKKERIAKGEAPVKGAEFKHNCKHYPHKYSMTEIIPQARDQHGINGITENDLIPIDDGSTE